LKVEGTEDTYKCPACGRKVRFEQNMDQHMEKHDREHDTTSIENRKCKLEGCEGKGYVYKTNQVYIMHEVSVVLETNGRFTQLTMSHLAKQRSSTGTGWKACCYPHGKP
jgi:hypothetical protein